MWAQKCCSFHLCKFLVVSRELRLILCFCTTFCVGYISIAVWFLILHISMTTLVQQMAFPISGFTLFYCMWFRILAIIKFPSLVNYFWRMSMKTDDCFNFFWQWPYFAFYCLKKTYESNQNCWILIDVSELVSCYPDWISLPCMALPLVALSA